MKTKMGGRRGGRSVSERKPRGNPSRSHNTAGKSNQPKISTILKNEKNKFSKLQQSTKSEPGPSKIVVTLDIDEDNNNNGPHSSQAPDFVSDTNVLQDENLMTEEEEQTMKELSDTDKEKILEGFDLDPTYGPCRGISRMERLQRVYRYQFLPEPPSLVAPILRKSYHNPRFNTSLGSKSRVVVGSQVKSIMQSLPKQIQSLPEQVPIYN